MESVTRTALAGKLNQLMLLLSAISFHLDFKNFTLSGKALFSIQSWAEMC